MKPYLAVILDSFQAAACSRILWVMLVLITLFLLAITPISLDEVAEGGTDPSPVPTGLQLRYAGKDFGPAIQLPAQTTVELRSVALAWFMDHVVDFIVGFFGIFVALVVSCSVIPDTYRTGSIELLLSKPISRPLLFLAKFVGGCAFVFMNISYLMFGFYIIVGLRWGLWDGRILVAIPVFVFYFMLLFSVSALVGLFSRSAILALFITLLFWGSCILIGSSKQAMEKLLPLDEKPDNVTVATEVKSKTSASIRDAQFWQSVYAFGVVPLYTVLPKPLELDDTVQYFLDRRRERKVTDPWFPVVTSGLFLVVVVGICCLKSWRAEY